MMRLATRVLLLAFLAVPLALAAPTAAHAVQVEIDGGWLVSPEPPAAPAACTIAAGSVNTFHYFWTPPEELRSMAWRIPTASCTDCPPGSSLNLKSVRFRVRWPIACSAQAKVSIVGAVPGPGCLLPDTNNVICPEVTYTIRNTTPGVAAVVHTLQLSSACCVTGDAFLLVRFDGFGICSGAVGPGLAASTAPCVACQQFVTASGIFETPTDHCTTGAANLVWFSIDADCCQVTDSPGRTWGHVKSLYR